MKRAWQIVFAVLVASLPGTAWAQNPAPWTSLGAPIHSGKVWPLPFFKTAQSKTPESSATTAVETPTEKHSWWPLSGHSSWWPSHGHEGHGQKCCTVYVFGDYLLLHARNVDVSYAQPRDGVTATAVPVGPVGQIAPDYKTGYRAGAGVSLGTGCALQGTYTSYHMSASNNITIPAAPAGSLLHSLLTFPTTANVAADSQDASATYEIDFRLADIDLTNTLFGCQGENYHVRWLLGGRYAHLSQEFQANYQILGATTVASNILFDGGGVRFGLEGEYYCHCGIFIYGKGVANLLAGRFSASYVQNAVFAGQQAATSMTDNRLVPILESEAGLGWQSNCGRVRLSAGYMLNSWYNTITTPGLIQSVRNSNFTTNGDNNRDTLSFDGFSARIMFRY